MPPRSILVLLDMNDHLSHLQSTDFLHSNFFIRCTSRDGLVFIAQQHGETSLYIDFVLPDSCIDMINNLRTIGCQRISFHVYCDSEELLARIQSYLMWTLYDKIFNANQLESKLRHLAQEHIIKCLDDLGNRDDDEAVHLRTVFGQLLEDNAIAINEEIRQRSGLSIEVAELDEESA